VDRVLRRQPTRLVEGQPEGGYADVYEIICCDCGDDPDLDYREVSLRLQLVRGPYPPAAGVAAYEHHLKLHEQVQRATGTKAAIALLMGAYLAVIGPVTPQLTAAARPVSLPGAPARGSG